jgi:hypothetical protein
VNSSRQVVPVSPAIGFDAAETWPNPDSDPDSARGHQPTPPELRTLWGEPLKRLVAIALALFAIAFAIAAPVAIRVKGISVFDEPTHADYAYQVAHGHIPARGSLIAPAIRAEMVCRGTASNPAAPRPHCGEVSPPVALFGPGAENYNFGHPPLYYAITGALARLAGLPFSGNHFILFARLVGVLWLFAAMLVLYLALRRFRVSWPIAAVAAGLLATSPALFYPAATVTNDAAAALAGSMAALLLARITVEGKLGWKLPALISLLVAATKILNAVPVLVVALVLLVLGVREWRVDRPRAVQLLRIALGIVVGVLVVYVGWTVLQNHRGEPNWVSPIAGRSSRPIHGAPFDELFSTSFSSFTVLSTGYVPAMLNNSWLAALLRVWGPLGVAALGAVLAVHRTWTPRFTLAAVTVIGLIAVPWAVELQVYASSGKYFPHVVPRYSAAFVPLTIACIAIAADHRHLRKSMSVFAGICLAIALYSVL